MEGKMNREEMIQDIFYKLPHTFRRMSAKIRPPSGGKKQTFMLLHAISHNDNKPMSFYSDFLMIPKSNLSVASDQLIAEGLIERVSTIEDRRVICLRITESGKNYMRECQNQMIRNTSDQLSVLSDGDIEELHGHVLGIVGVLEKIYAEEKSVQN